MKEIKINKLKTAVLGCTGLVGQQFVRMLAGHPFFEVTVLTASKQSIGKKYRDAVNWSLGGDVPSDIGNIVLTDNSAGAIFKKDVIVVFSALPSQVAEEIERTLADKGLCIFSNASAHRLKPDVPILIPEVNTDHLGLVKAQLNVNKGYIVTNPNCSTTGLVIALRPIIELGLKKVYVSTYQAISGAGRKGLFSIDIQENVIPFIDGEEEKIEQETKKIFGWLENGSIKGMGLEIFAGCCRVPVRDGHLQNVMVDLEENVELEEISHAMHSFRSAPQNLGLPTAPEKPIIVRSENNRPQPTLDRLAGTPKRAQGMAVSVGRIRKKGKRLLFTLLVNNTIRGAAGTCILNAEMAVAQNLISFAH